MSQTFGSKRRAKHTLNPLSTKRVAATYEPRSPLQNLDQVVRRGLLCPCCLIPFAPGKRGYTICDHRKSDVVKRFHYLHPLLAECAQAAQEIDDQVTFKLCNSCHGVLDKFSTFKEKVGSHYNNYLCELKPDKVRHGVRIHDLALRHAGKDWKECARAACLCCGRQLSCVSVLRVHQKAGRCKSGCSKCQSNVNESDSPSKCSNTKNKDENQNEKDSSESSRIKNKEKMASKPSENTSTSERVDKKFKMTLTANMESQSNKEKGNEKHINISGKSNEIDSAATDKCDGTKTKPGDSIEKLSAKNNENEGSKESNNKTVNQKEFHAKSTADCESTKENDPNKNSNSKGNSSNSAYLSEKRTADKCDGNKAKSKDSFEKSGERNNVNQICKESKKTNNSKENEEANQLKSTANVNNGSGKNNDGEKCANSGNKNKSGDANNSEGTGDKSDRYTSSDKKMTEKSNDSNKENFVPKESQNTNNNGTLEKECRNKSTAKVASENTKEQEKTSNIDRENKSGQPDIGNDRHSKNCNSTQKTHRLKKLNNKIKERYEQIVLKRKSIIPLPYPYPWRPAIEMPWTERIMIHSNVAISVRQTHVTKPANPSELNPAEPSSIINNKTNCNEQDRSLEPLHIENLHDTTRKLCATIDQARDNITDSSKNKGEKIIYEWLLKVERKHPNEEHNPIEETKDVVAPPQCMNSDFINSNNHENTSVETASISSQQNNNNIKTKDQSLNKSDSYENNECDDYIVQYINNESESIEQPSIKIRIINRRKSACSEPEKSTETVQYTDNIMNSKEHISENKTIDTANESTTFSNNIASSLLMSESRYRTTDHLTSPQTESQECADETDNLHSIPSNNDVNKELHTEQTNFDDLVTYNCTKRADANSNEHENSHSSISDVENGGTKSVMQTNSLDNAKQIPSKGSEINPLTAENEQFTASYKKKAKKTMRLPSGGLNRQILRDTQFDLSPTIGLNVTESSQSNVALDTNQCSGLNHLENISTIEDVVCNYFKANMSSGTNSDKNNTSVDNSRPEITQNNDGSHNSTQKDTDSELVGDGVFENVHPSSNNHSQYNPNYIHKKFKSVAHCPLNIFESEQNTTANDALINQTIVESTLSDSQLERNLQGIVGHSPFSSISVRSQDYTDASAIIEFLSDGVATRDSEELKKTSGQNRTAEAEDKTAKKRRRSSSCSSEGSVKKRHKKNEKKNSYLDIMESQESEDYNDMTLRLESVDSDTSADRCANPNVEQAVPEDILGQNNIEEQAVREDILGKNNIVVEEKIVKIESDAHVVNKNTVQENVGHEDDVIVLSSDDEDFDEDYNDDSNSSAPTVTLDQIPSPQNHDQLHDDITNEDGDSCDTEVYDITDLDDKNKCGYDSFDSDRIEFVKKEKETTAQTEPLGDIELGNIAQGEDTEPGVYAPLANVVENVSCATEQNMERSAKIAERSKRSESINHVPTKIPSISVRGLEDLIEEGRTSPPLRNRSQTEQLPPQTPTQLPLQLEPPTEPLKLPQFAPQPVLISELRSLQSHLPTQPCPTYHGASQRSNPSVFLVPNAGHPIPRQTPEPTFHATNYPPPNHRPPSGGRMESSVHYERPDRPLEFRSRLPTPYPSGIDNRTPESRSGARSGVSQNQWSRKRNNLPETSRYFDPNEHRSRKSGDRR